MRKFNNVDGVYKIINQPKHLVASVVLVDIQKFPLSKELHDNLCSLSDISDIIFMFLGDQNYGIHIHKFSSLYQSCGWTVTGSSLGHSLIKTLKYIKSVFEKHIIFNILNLSDLEGDSISNIIFKIISPNIGIIKKPVFSISRLSSDEMFQYYKEGCGGGELTLKAPKGFFENLFLGAELVNNDSEIGCRYMTWTTTSRIIIVPRISLNTILPDLEHTWVDEFLSSFTEPDIKVIIVNLVKRLGLSFLDKDITNLDV